MCKNREKWKVNKWRNLKFSYNLKIFPLCRHAVHSSIKSDQRMNKGGQYVCRRCAHSLFTDENASHGHSKGCADTGASGKSKAKWARKARLDSHCTSIFFDEAPDWAADKTVAHAGDLKCPNCNVRVGSYSWSGANCSCGRWIAPSFQFPLAKVDAKLPKVALDLSVMARTPPPPPPPARIINSTANN